MPTKRSLSRRGRVKVQKMDRISGLPENILHYILSRLPERDAVRTSILSKAWRETWSTFPVVSICDSLFTGYFQLDKNFKSQRKAFRNYVKKTLLRFRHRGLAIKEFKLSVNCFGLRHMSRYMDRWMEWVSESGVEVLELDLPKCPEPDEDGSGVCYILKPGVIEAKSLNNLSLLGGIRVDIAFRNHNIKCFSLRVLSLSDVVLGDEGALEHLISHCPLIEQITLNSCSVYKPRSIEDIRVSRTSPLKSLNMHGLQKLKDVDVQGIHEVYIDAPNLENLCYCHGMIDAPFKLNYDSCRNLRVLYLRSLRSTVFENQWFLELFTKFPLLESLKLATCSMSERINISSAKLKFLELTNCYGLKEVNIDAPYLLSCGYSGGGDDKPVINFLRCSGQLEVNVQINMKYQQLSNLREFIENFKPQKVLASLTIFIYQPYVEEVNPDVLDVLQVSSLLRIKRLYIRSVPKKEAFYLPLVNHLLSCCCPETISLSLHSNFCSKAFIKFFYETLMGRNQDDCCYCSSSHIKCWWHGLKDFKITSSVEMDEDVDFTTMLDEFPTFAPEEYVSFELEF